MPVKPLRGGGSGQDVKTGAFTDLANCSACGLFERCHRPKIPGRGFGLRPDVAFVGEAPGGEEDLKGKPFVGAAGQVAEKALRACGIDTDRVWFTNVVKCRPPNNRTPSPKEVQACRPAILAELAFLKPKVVVLAGKTAYQSIFKGSISDARGKWFEKEGTYYVPTWHPARILREKQYYPELLADLRLAKKIMEAGKPVLTFPPVHLCKTIEEVRSEMSRMLVTAKEVAFDFEATGLHPENPEFQVLTCSFSYGDGFGIPFDDKPSTLFVVPLFHQGSPLSPEEREEAVEWIRRFLGEEKIAKIVQNAPYEYQTALASFGCGIAGRIWDTLGLHQLYDELSAQSLEYFSWQFTPLGGYKSLAEDHLKGLKRSERRYGDIPLVTFKKVVDEEATKKLQAEYLALRTAYDEEATARAEKLSILAFKRALKKAGEGAALGIGREKYKAVLEKALLSKKRPRDPGPVLIDTDEVVGGLAIYNGVDSAVTRFLKTIFLASVKKKRTLSIYEDSLEPALHVFSKMMSRGAKVDRVFLTAAQLHLEREIERQERRLLARKELSKVAAEFNWASTQQVGKLLFEDLKYRLPISEEDKKNLPEVEWGIKRTPTGQYVVDEEVLGQLAKKYRGIPAILQKMRGLEKTRGVVAAFLSGKANKEAHLQASGRVHTTYLLSRVKTGRLSSKEPNLQNLPHSPSRMEATEEEIGKLVEAYGEEELGKIGWKKKDKDRNGGEDMLLSEDVGCDFVLRADGNIYKSIFLKKAFVPSWDGGYLIGADYSGVELRVLASVSRCRQLIEDLTTGGGDVHRMTASTIFGVPPEKVPDDMRQQAKKSLFSILYGKGIRGNAEDLGISEAQSRRISSGIFTRYPEVSLAIEDCHRNLMDNGLVRDVNSRVRHFPGVYSGEQEKIAAAKREAFNFLIQGPAGRLTTDALVRIWNFLETNGYQSRPCLTVHDSIDVDTHPEEKDVVIPVVRQIMESPVVDWLLVPLKVDMTIGKSWGSSTKIKPQTSG